MSRITRNVWYVWIKWFDFVPTAPYPIGMSTKRATINDVITSVESLARITKTGFDEVNGRLDKVEGRLDRVEGRLDRVEGKLDKMDGRLLNIEADVSYLKAKSTAIDIAASKHEDEHDRINMRLKKLEKARN